MHLKATDHLHQGEESPLLSLPFDHYQRYALTRRLVPLLWPRHKGRALKILDVGGHSSPLKQFLSTHIVVLVDIQLPGSFTTIPLVYDTYLLATGTKLPLADLSFDLVTANDTLEHVPDADRPAFLQELLRVSRRFVILNGPTYHPQTAEAEQRFARFLQRALSEKSDFLQEHIHLGLPKGEDIEKVLNERGRPFIDIPNGNLALWLAMNTAKNYVRAFLEGDQLSRILDHTYNLVLSPRDFGGLCYRKAYVIAKSRDDAKTLQRVRATFPPVLDKQPAWEDAEALEILVAALEEHGGKVRRNTQALQATIADLQRELERLETALTNNEAALAEKDAGLAARDAALAAKDEDLALKNKELVQKEAHLRDVQMQLQATTSTLGYRLLERVRRGINWLAPVGARRRVPLALARRALHIFLTEGWMPLLRRLPHIRRWAPRLWRTGASATWDLPLNEQYQLWLRYHALIPRAEKTIKKTAKRLNYRPKVSVIMPVYNTDPRWLREAVESVRRQLYDNWELCVADDGSTRAATREVLREYERRDARIKVKYLDRNRGIGAASNEALSLATGEFIGLLDHDDELRSDALFEVVKLLNERRDLDYIYSDEDKKDPDGRLVDPFFKPDWSPALLFSLNYVTHFSVFRKEIVDSLGGFRLGYDGSQDYDLILRVTEMTDGVAHIPKPLYTWRKIPGSAATSPEAKEFAYPAAKRAIKDALTRRGIQGEVEDGPFKGYYRVRYAIPGKPRVAIIIPTRDMADMLRRCVESIRRKSSYRNYEIIVVDNDSGEPQTLEYLSSFAGRVIPYPHEFNFARMMNVAARQVDCDALLFLNNDTEVISADWIEAMLEPGMQADVAAVGARLLYPGGQVQHEGTLVGPRGGLAGNLDHRGYFGLGEVIRNCSAVTAACMLTKPRVFWELGGFDEQLGVAYNDVDFCLRARQRGYLIVYTPYSVLRHHEGGTRGRAGKTHPTKDEDLFRLRWGKYKDPYYNPNLDVDRPLNIRLERR